MSENFYYYLIYPENNYDNKCFFSCFCIYFSWKCLFSFSGNIYYLFCLELPNTNHFVRKTTLVNNTRTWPAQRHSALSITLSDQQRQQYNQIRHLVYFRQKNIFLIRGILTKNVNTFHLSSFTSFQEVAEHAMSTFSKCPL